MREARILHFEDSDSLREMVALSLESSTAHRVVDSAATLPDALAKLDRVYQGLLDVNVVLLDGNLEGGFGGRHARVITQYMQELGLLLPTIGMSSDSMAEIGVKVTEDLTKDGYTIEKLDQMLIDLAEPELPLEAQAS